MFVLLINIAPYVLGVVVLVSIVNVLSNFSRAQRAPYYRIRRDSARAGWRWVVIGALCSGGIYAAIVLKPEVEAMTFDLASLLPPPPEKTATVSLEAILTTTPGTPAATRNPLELPPTITPTLPATTLPPTPFISTIESPVTPSPEAAIKLTAISTSITTDLKPSDPGTFFSTGQPRVYFFISFEHMANGISWSRALLLDGKVIRTITEAWDQGETGTAYYWFETPGGFPIGSYQIQFYIGDKLTAQGAFTLR